MAQAFEGALVALQRVAEQRAVDCADEVARHRSWLLNCVSETKALLAEQRAGAGPALQVKRARGKKGAQETAGKENGDDAAERPARGRRGRPQPDTASADAELVLCEPAAPAQGSVAERADPQATVESVEAKAEPVVDTACDNAGLAVAEATAAVTEQEQLLRQLSAAAAVPLPSLPAKSPAEVPAPPRASPPAAADGSPALQVNAMQVDSQAPAGEAPPVVKQSGKILALQAAEFARKQEQRILDERQAKKAELERQREAARRVAMQQPPSVPSATADVSAMPPPPMSSAVPPAAGKIAAPVLPARLQQAMQAHQQLTEAHRRDAEEKLLLAEEAKRKVEESNARAEELRVAVSRLPAAAASIPLQAPASAPAAAAPVIVPAALPALPKPATASVAAIHAIAPPQVAPTPLPAVVAPAELQSYEISPYKSGSDSDEDAAERPRKPVPAWARSDALAPVLYAQAKADPDAIFQNPSKTCSLDEVFQCAGNKKRDFSRRGSSGNWTEDQLTWKEEMSFKRRMGYATGMSEATPRSVQGGSRT